MTLLTGIGGDAWVDAARAWSLASGVPVAAHRIGPGQDYADMFGDRAWVSGVSEDGALLAWPDGHVAWRSGDGMTGPDAPIAALETVLALPSDAGTRAVRTASKAHETEWT